MLTEQTKARSPEKQTHYGPEDLDQECEMLDVSWVGIVRIELLKMRSEHDLGTESEGIYRHGSIRRRG